jgi:predicted ATPase
MSMPQNNWFVITGGPSTGKTTLLNALAEHGYITIPEAARLVIDDGLAAGLTIDQIRGDEAKFQADVLERKILIENELHDGHTAVLDRGIHDSIAYTRLYDEPVSEKLKKAAQTAAYKQVFLLEPLATYEQDYARTESPELVAKLHQLLHDAYAEHGMQPILVPALPVPERVKFVLQHIDEPPTLDVA